MTNHEDNGVTIIVPTYGRTDYLSRALISLIDQDYDDLSIIVVDDNTGTQFRREAKEICEKLGTRGRAIHYHAHEKNRGGSAARNTGLHLVKTRYCGFLDDDDVYAKSNVSEHVATLKETGSAVSYCNYYTVNPHRDTPKLGSMVNYHGNVRQQLLSGWCPTSTSLFLIDIIAARQHCHFDEALPSFQDYDLWIRLSEHFEFAYCDNPLVFKYQHEGDQVSRNVKKRTDGMVRLRAKYQEQLSGSDWSLLTQGLQRIEKHGYFIRFKEARGRWDLPEMWHMCWRYFFNSSNQSLGVIPLLKAVIRP